jgi:hypothetical protein
MTSHWYDLTRRLNPYQPAPSYGQAAEGVAAGTPGSATGMTKLGKLLTILQGAGTGAAVGSTQMTFGRGLMAADQFQNQQAQERQAQEAHAMNLAVQRAQLANLPMMMDFQRQQMALNQDYLRSRAELNRQSVQTKEAQEERQRQLAGQLPKPIVSGNRLIRQAVPTDDPSKVMANGYVDVGEAPVKTQTPERQDFDYLTSHVDPQLGRVMTPDEAVSKIAQSKASGKAATPYGKLKPEIYAQIGALPETSTYKGQDLGSVEAARAAWGRDYQHLQTQEAIAPAQARGQAYGYYRVYNGIDPTTGVMRPMWAGEAVQNGVLPASEGMKIMSKEAQFNDINFASQQMRKALNGLDEKFSPTQVALLTAAMKEEDPTIRNNEIGALVTQNLTEPQRDFVTWANQLNERAMSLRNLAGMGQGSEDLRDAVRNTLPGVRSGDRAMALKQLDAFDNLTANLRKGIPKGAPPPPKKGNAPAAPPAPSAAVKGTAKQTKASKYGTEF